MSKPELKPQLITKEDDDELRLRFQMGGWNQDLLGDQLPQAAYDLARLVVTYSAKSREQSLALTKLEEAMLWAKAAINRER